ncbi:hypothetical protein DNU06_13730 [Putridiphycobacter roseus]|uniref:Uncharacterized protein n=2 Tax=Putridiphycobacter roseus TaxID=2219161 RepID=A0A2W1NP31_9FLAO|nr:hypothetical protein DNU06_13730 [Putridiphycobacter roseus]
MSVQSYGQGFQDSIILLNGKTFRGDFIELNDDYLVFNSPNKKGDFQMMIEKYRVFSYTKDGMESVLYEHQPDSDNFLTVDQSRKFTLGSYDARNAYSVKPVFYVSLGLTYSVALMDTYLTKKEAAGSVTPGLQTGFFGRAPSILPMGMILVMPISFGLPSTKVREKNILQTGLRNDQFYYEGFNSVARQRRSLAALKGSALGVLLGYASYYALKTNNY